MRYITASKGFTLIELITAIIIFSLLAGFAAVIIRITVTAADSAAARQEALFQAQNALNFTKKQTELANGYKIWTLTGSDALRFLDLFTALAPGGAEHNYIIRYEGLARTVEFGGIGTGYGVNELAGDITQMFISADEEKELMYITVTAEYMGESVTLSTAVSLTGKEAR